MTAASEVERRDVRRESGDHPEGENRTGDRARNGQQRPFDEQLADERRAAAAEGSADRELALAPKRAREQQVGNVEAAQNEQHGCCAKKEVEGARVVARVVRPQVEQFDAMAGMARGKGLGDAGSDGLQLSFRLADLHTRPQPSVDVKGPGRARAEVWCRAVDRQVEVRLGRELQSRIRQHADDLVGLVIERHRSADRSRVRREQALPPGIGQDRHARSALVSGVERPAQTRDIPQHVEEIRGDPLDGDGFRAFPAQNSPRSGFVRRVFRQSPLCLPVPDVRAGDSLGRQPGPRRGGLNGDQLVRIGQGQRPPQLRVDDAHHCDGRRAAERQGEQSGERERRLAAQRADAVTHIGPHALDQRRRSRRDARLRAPA